ncbi:MAG: Crp/Fnr family transcriptional regulator [Terracidiphilus sp.]
MNQFPRAFKNRILESLPQAEIDRIAPHLSHVTLAQHELLLDGKPTHGYFLESGIASVVITLGNGETVETGLVGVDGVVGVPILLGGQTAPGRTFVQIAGSAYRIPAAKLKEEFERTSEFRQRLEKYVQSCLVETAQTAACNRLHTTEERLARWLLVCRDRMETDELRLTHEFLGQMLGEPRTTVTLAAGLLHRAGMIDFKRGTVTIVNRGQLESSACECYHTVRDSSSLLGAL